MNRFNIETQIIKLLNLPATTTEFVLKMKANKKATIEYKYVLPLVVKGKMKVIKEQYEF